MYDPPTFGSNLMDPAFACVKAHLKPLTRTEGISGQKALEMLGRAEWLGARACRCSGCTSFVCMRYTFLRSTIVGFEASKDLVMKTIVPLTTEVFSISKHLRPPREQPRPLSHH